MCFRLRGFVGEIQDKKGGESREKIKREKGSFCESIVCLTASAVAVEN